MAAVDPGAIYSSTLADLALVAGNERALIGENEGFLRTNVNNAENLLTGQEPGVYTAESNRANKGNILSSGANANRKATIASNYAAKRTANQAKLNQGLETYKREGEGVGLKEIEGVHTAAEKKALGEEAVNAANPTLGTVPPVKALRPGGYINRAGNEVITPGSQR